MKNKLLSAGIAALLVIGIIVTAILTFGPLDLSNFPNPGNRFGSSSKLYRLTVSATEGGSVDKESGDYADGSVVELSATPDEGYVFVGWYSDRNVYLSASATYSLTIHEDTAIRARFSLKPEEMSGDAQQLAVLHECAEDFSFVIKCDKENAEEYLYKNLKIVDTYFAGTEYEDYTAQAFTLTKSGNDEYIVTPKDSTYKKGASYTAVLPHTVKEEENEFGEKEEILIAEHANIAVSGIETPKLEFTVKMEESSVVEHKEGIVFISHDGGKNDPVIQIIDDGLIEGDEADAPDMLVLSSSNGLVAGDIFCIYDGTLDENKQPALNENTLYGKVVEVKNSNNKFYVTYTMPDLAEIFGELNISGSSDINFEKEGIEFNNQEIADQVRHQIRTSGEFWNSVAESEAAIALIAQNYGYEAEFISLGAADLADMFQVNVKHHISGTSANVDIDISFSIPLKKGGKQVASVTLSLIQRHEISLSAYSRVALSYWWFIPTGISEMDMGITNVVRTTTSVKLGISYDRGTPGIADLEKNINEDFYKMIFGADLGQKPIYNTAKELLKEGGYSSATQTNFKLCEFRLYNFSPVTINVELNLTLSFDIAGSLSMTDTRETSVTVGIKKGYNGIQTYSNRKASCSTKSLLITGAVEVRAGVTAKAYFSMMGLSKYVQAGMSAGTGVYIRAEGIVSISDGIYGGNIEAGMYMNVSVNYKVFYFNSSYILLDKKIPLFRYGYRNAMIEYADQPLLLLSLQKIGIKRDEALALFKLELMKVNKLDTSSGAITQTALLPDSKDYKVKIVLGDNSNLVYDPSTGTITAKDNAPLYFKETISIEVEQNGAWKTCPADSVSCFVCLPKIDIQIVCGNEDEYYASIDNQQQSAYRKLFRSYNEKTKDLLMKEFNTILEDSVNVSEKYKVIYDNIMKPYISNLFALISSERKTEDEDRKHENKFVDTEALAFSDTVNLLNYIMTEKTVQGKADDMLDILEKVLQSKAMYDTLIDIKDNEVLNQLAERFDVLQNAEKQTIHDVIDKFASRHSGDARAKALSEAFRKFFRFKD